MHDAFLFLRVPGRRPLFAGRSARQTKATTPGLILTGKSVVMPQVANVQAYQPLEQVDMAGQQNRIPDEVVERVFREALALPWAALAHLS